MKKSEKETVNNCIKDIESVWLKIEQGKPIDHYDQGKLSGVIGALRKLTK